MRLYFLKTNWTKEENGFTLIEIFGVMIIVTFGLLALLSMKVSALRKANDSEHTILANRIVQKVSARIQENGANVQLYDGMQTAANLKTNCPEQNPLSTCDEDFKEWQNAVSALPKGDLSIALDSKQSPQKVDLKLSWQDQAGSHKLQLPIHVNESIPQKEDSSLRLDPK